MKNLTTHSLLLSLTLVLLVSAPISGAWAQKNIKEEIKKDKQKVYENLKSQEETKDEDRQEKVKKLRENVCADDSGKEKTEAVGVCLNCLQGSSQDEVEKIKIDTSKMETEEQEKKFLLLMKSSGRLQKVSKYSVCNSIAECEKMVKQYETSIEENKIQLEKNKKKNDEHFAAFEAFLQSDLTKTPLPKVTMSYNPYIDNLFMAFYNKSGSSSLYKKVQKAYNSWMSGSDKVILDPEIAKVFVENGKAIKKGEISSSSYNYGYDKELQRIYATLEGLKDAHKEIPRKTSAEDEVKELQEFAEQRLREVSKQTGFKRCSLSSAELYALYDYSSAGYGQVNGALRSGGQDAEKYAPYKQVLNSALKKLRPYNDFVDRGADLPEKVLEQYQVGAIIDSPAFTSTSAFSGFTRKHKFTIKTKTGAYIAPYSNHTGEEEVLIPAGVKFKVLERKPGKEKGSIQFVLEEVDP